MIQKSPAQKSIIEADVFFYGTDVQKAAAVSHSLVKRPEGYADHSISSLGILGSMARPVTIVRISLVHK